MILGERHHCSVPITLCLNENICSGHPRCTATRCPPSISLLQVATPPTFLRSHSGPDGSPLMLQGHGYQVKVQMATIPTMQDQDCPCCRDTGYLPQPSRAALSAQLHGWGQAHPSPRQQHPQCTFPSPLGRHPVPCSERRVSEASMQ